MEIGLLWGILVLFFILASGIVVSEMRRPSSVERVLLIFLENNEEITEATLKNICRKARWGKVQVQVVVIDNCSTDSTRLIVQRLERYFPEIFLLARNDPETINPNWLKSLLGNVSKVFDFRDMPQYNMPFAPISTLA